MINYLCTLILTQKEPDLFTIFCYCFALDIRLLFFFSMFLCYFFSVAVNICVLIMDGWLRWLWLSGSHPLIFLLCDFLFVE